MNGSDWRTQLVRYRLYQQRFTLVSLLRGWQSTFSSNIKMHYYLHVGRNDTTADQHAQFPTYTVWILQGKPPAWNSCSLLWTYTFSSPPPCLILASEALWHTVHTHTRELVCYQTSSSNDLHYCYRWDDLEKEIKGKTQQAGEGAAIHMQNIISTFLRF